MTAPARHSSRSVSGKTTGARARCVLGITDQRICSESIRGGLVREEVMCCDVSMFACLTLVMWMTIYMDDYLVIWMTISLYRLLSSYMDDYLFIWMTNSLYG